MTNSDIDTIRHDADTALLAPSYVDPAFRPYSVTLITRTSSPLPSGRLVAGGGTTTGTSLILQNGNSFDGYSNPNYRVITEKDIILSGGYLKDVKAIIGPLVFAYNDNGVIGGYDPLFFSQPSPTANTITDLLLQVQGPDFPIGGVLFKKFSTVSDHRIMFRLYIMNTGA